MKRLASRVLKIALLILLYSVLPTYYRGVLVGIILCRAFYIMRTNIIEELRRWEHALNNDLENGGLRGVDE